MSKTVTIVCGPRRSGKSTLLKRLGCLDVSAVRSNKKQKLSKTKLAIESGGSRFSDSLNKILDDASEIRVYSTAGDVGYSDNLMNNILTKAQNAKVSNVCMVNSLEGRISVLETQVKELMSIVKI